jgi:hypothetical protein
MSQAFKQTTALQINGGKKKQKTGTIKEKKRMYENRGENRI